MYYFRLYAEDVFSQKRNKVMCHMSFIIQG